MIEYRESAEGITEEHLSDVGFFENWKKIPPPDVHLKHLQNCDHVVLALDTETGKVIGFASALSDGVMSAYIDLLEVVPAYREKGIGSELMRRILKKLEPMYMIDLVCDEKMVPYYERFGMKKSTGMIIRNMHDKVSDILS